MSSFGFFRSRAFRSHQPLRTSESSSMEPVTSCNMPLSESGAETGVDAGPEANAETGPRASPELSVGETPTSTGADRPAGAPPPDPDTSRCTSVDFSKYHTSPTDSPNPNSLLQPSANADTTPSIPPTSARSQPAPAPAPASAPNLIPPPLRPFALKDTIFEQIDPDDALVLARNPQDRVTAGIRGCGGNYEHLPPVGAQPSFTTRASHASGHPPMLRHAGASVQPLNAEAAAGDAPAADPFANPAVGYPPRLVPPSLPARPGVNLSTNPYGIPVVPQTHEYTGRISRKSVIKPRSAVYGQSSTGSPSAAFDRLSLSPGKTPGALPVRDTVGELNTHKQSHEMEREGWEDEESIRQASVVMVDLLTNVHIEKECPILEELTIQISKRYKRPAASIALSLRHGVCMVYGGSMDPAYILTLYAEPSQVSESANRRNTILLQRVVRDTINVPPSRGTIRFVAVPDDCLGYNNTTLQHELNDLQRQRHADSQRRSRAAAPVPLDAPVTPARTKPGEHIPSRSLMRMKSFVGLRPALGALDPTDPSTATATDDDDEDADTLSPPRHSTDSKRAVFSASVAAANGTLDLGSPQPYVRSASKWGSPKTPTRPRRGVSLTWASATAAMGGAGAGALGAGGSMRASARARAVSGSPQMWSEGDGLVKSKKSFVSLMFGRRVKGDGSPLKNENVPLV
ncbi:hypothetical protein BROUX41_003799 [Berkeleyomyces rouxiae]|uniref:uncharacterized protein n=1 Tax=Berkeleyomyces rouxiae TaxID=2035830 RepID=UPI003B7CA7D0